ncbi:hypothetical protein [Pseudalkalibacillus hwajinpoensis]|uniref:hypothetical protein n=1 Tax=Guptibacillus hwajinpoensis TaxID=208199 RepID=UPI001CFF0018|nr:hypothetical protein [Pseudalkalibacillus hwajinpoensis]
MKYAVSVTDTKKTEEIERSGLELLAVLESYQVSLNNITSIEEQPRGMIFHDLESATKLYSTIPLPAYTSRDLIHLTPLLETWKDIYLTTTNGVKEAEDYYRNLEIVDVAEIAAHELTHHADFFHSEFEDWEEEHASDMWFEEGICFYLPRKLLMSEERFERVMEVERLLIEAYKEEYGEYSLDAFGEAGYRGGDNFAYSAAFYDYWRSTRTVARLIDEYCKGEVQKLIGYYREWVDGGEKGRLQDFFVQRFKLSSEEAEGLWLHSKVKV